MIDLLSTRTRYIESSELAEIVSKIESLVNRGYRVIPFAVGEPDPSAIPIKELSKILADILAENPSSILYTPTEGIEDLRKEIANFIYRYDGYRVDYDNIIVTSGATLAIDLILRLFIDPGDIVIVENPSYINTIHALKSYGAKIIGVKMDSRGMDTYALEEILRSMDSNRVKLVYTMPLGQNPTGISMDLDRRRHLLELASQYNFIIVEDTAYNYLVLDNIYIPSLKSMDRERRVISVGTLSKVMGTGFRVGWTVLEEPIKSMAISIKQTVDFCAPAISQYLALEFLRRGLIDISIDRSRSIYRAKRDVLIEAVNTYISEAIYVKPIAGMFIMLHLPGIDGIKFAKELIEKYHVALLPGKPFYIDNSGRESIRICFARPSIEDIEIGIRYIADLYRSYISRS
ncbi:putative transcriptional regulator, GntR family [Ignisphaera aggregans DSM 17230]|uniref:Putative transcriptional regulator, GntR family n=1 Tax=Ignisphaera aggregans (strain DSM 17230 / JCM 13409 / AQ1.S1) TaxID=583356 RepID=E0STY9_IGNAA|nr:putative transcriptional regulator, GntR family [Ignisphaera aggregans DSM 17230]